MFLKIWAFNFTKYAQMIKTNVLSCYTEASEGRVIMEPGQHTKARSFELYYFFAYKNSQKICSP